MSYLVLGLSHRHAPFGLLEKVTVDEPTAIDLEQRLLASEHIAEVAVLSTCNRVEIYADCATFHGALADMVTELTRLSGIPQHELHEHAYVHYEERAISHAFRVAAGLDSMAVGEAEILGQLRRTLDRAQRQLHVGPALNQLLQHALRVGKRVHTETSIDAASVGLVDAGLRLAERRIGRLDRAAVAVVGAGAMSSLAATTARRRGIRALTVVNRSLDRGRRLAARVDADAQPLVALPEVLAAADVVITCTGAPGQVITADLVVGRERPLVLIDLAVPHDIDPDAARHPGVTLVTLADLGAELAATGATPAVQQAGDLVTAEVAAYQLSRSASAVGSTVAALRARAGELVSDEMARFERRNGQLTDAQRDEVRLTLHRVVEKLLHAPTVRVKQLAQDGQGGSYARALHELFDLDPSVTTTVSVPPSPEHDRVRETMRGDDA